MTLSIKASLRNTMVDILADALDAGSGAGKIAVYNGTRPTNVDTALSGNTKLIEFTLGDPACGTTSAGASPLVVSPVISANAITGGTATFFRAVDSTGTVVCDGSVGTSGADLNLSSTAMSSGQTIVITSGNFATLEG